MLPIYHHEPEHLLTAPWMYTEFREDLIRWPVNTQDYLPFAYGLYMDIGFCLHVVLIIAQILHGCCMD